MLCVPKAARYTDRPESRWQWKAPRTSRRPSFPLAHQSLLHIRAAAYQRRSQAEDIRHNVPPRAVPVLPGYTTHRLHGQNGARAFGTVPSASARSCRSPHRRPPS